MDQWMLFADSQGHKKGYLHCVCICVWHLHLWTKENTTQINFETEFCGISRTKHHQETAQHVKNSQLVFVLRSPGHCRVVWAVPACDVQACETSVDNS